MLDKERKAFARKRADLTAHHLGKFVLIKETKLIGSFNTVEEALAEGARRYGLSPFLVRQVTLDIQPDVDIPALKLGILSANSTRPV